MNVQQQERKHPKDDNIRKKILSQGERRKEDECLKNHLLIASEYFHYIKHIDLLFTCVQ